MVGGFEDAGAHWADEKSGSRFKGNGDSKLISMFGQVYAESKRFTVLNGNPEMKSVVKEFVDMGKDGFRSPEGFRKFTEVWVKNMPQPDEDKETKNLRENTKTYLGNRASIVDPEQTHNPLWKYRACFLFVFDYWMLDSLVAATTDDERTRIEAGTLLKEHNPFATATRVSEVVHFLKENSDVNVLSLSDYGEQFGDLFAADGWVETHFRKGDAEGVKATGKGTALWIRNSLGSFLDAGKKTLSKVDC